MLAIKMTVDGAAQKNIDFKDSKILSVVITGMSVMTASPALTHNVNIRVNITCIVKIFTSKFVLKYFFIIKPKQRINKI